MAAHPEHECRSCGVGRSDALRLHLEVNIVVGQASPVICLPGEDRGSGTDTRVADTGKGLLGKHPRALEVAGMFRSAPGGVEAPRARIVLFAELGCALERSPSRRLTAALGEAGGGSFECRGDCLVRPFGGRCEMPGAPVGILFAVERVGELAMSRSTLVQRSGVVDGRAYERVPERDRACVDAN